MPEMNLDDIFGKKKFREVREKRHLDVDQFNNNVFLIPRHNI